MTIEEENTDLKKRLETRYEQIKDQSMDRNTYSKSV